MCFFGPGDDYNTSYIKQVSRLYNPDYRNFAPRIGFAWSPKMANNKLVVRGGYGWFFNEIPGVVFENVFQDPPTFGSYGICCGTATTSFGTPFANGQILYALGSSNSPFSYPRQSRISYRHRSHYECAERAIESQRAPGTGLHGSAEHAESICTGVLTRLAVPTPRETCADHRL
jgi:hypothetical protein